MNAMLSKDKQLSRRSFLDWLIRGSLVGASMLGLGALFRYISFPTGSSSPNLYDLGLADQFPLGSQRVVLAGEALIVHDDLGFHAQSLVCPHLGCQVTADREGFSCPCHGSRFYPDGSLRNGPASGPLKSLRIEQDSKGHLILYND